MRDACLESVVTTRATISARLELELGHLTLFVDRVRSPLQFTDKPHGHRSVEASRRELRSAGQAMVVHLQTVFAHNAASILRRLTASLEPFAKSRSHALVFSISPAPSLPADELSQLVSYFQALQPDRVGCLSTPAPLVTPAYDKYGGMSTSCSVALFDRRMATPFRSTIPGRETAQVGRWHALRKKEEPHQDATHVPGQDVDWEGLWARKDSGHALPGGACKHEVCCLLCHSLSGVLTHIHSVENVNTLLYFSDDAPEGLVSSLSTFQKANQVGEQVVRVFCS